jgi:SRSO17 transposase
MTRVREATHTVACIDAYCAHYRAVFHNVRHFEQFTQLILGMLAETKRKSLPRLARTVQGEHQALHHFLANAEWSLEELRAIRLSLACEALAGRAFLLRIDETGDPKKGQTTDYVASQYLGSVQHVEPEIVSVNAYGVLDNVTFPLACALYKPKTCLKPGDVFRTKPELALDLIQQLLALGLHVDVVLADTVYGEHPGFVSALDQLGLHYVVAIRSTHGVWMDVRQRIRTTPWRAFERVFADGSSQQRYLQETIFGRRRGVRYCQISTDPMRRPRESTWLLMTNLPGKIEQSVGNTFGLRTWIDEHRIGLKPFLHKVWTLGSQRPFAPVEHRFAWRYLVGFVHPASGRTIFHLASSVSIALFEAELEVFAAEVGAGPHKHVILVLDRAGWHASVRLRVPEHVHLLFLPAYSPELQPAEHLWSMW